MRTVLITGASSDIGLAVCRRFLASGDHRIVAHYRTARPEFDALLADGDRVRPWQCDFAVPGAVEAALEDAGDQIRNVDVLVNLAAAFAPTSFPGFAVDQLVQTLRVNLFPGLLLMQALGPAMAARGYGRIVHASSIGVTFGGGQDSFAYALSKHAMEFIPRACRAWARDNVLTNVVRIGVTDTRLHGALPGKDLNQRAALIPMGRAALPGEIAELIYWLGSAANTYVTGEIIAASGGE